MKYMEIEKGIKSWFQAINPAIKRAFIPAFIFINIAF